MGKDELSTFYGLVEWFVREYCAGYELEGPIYLVLDNSIVQDFKHLQMKKRWLRAQSYVAFTRFVSIFSDRKTCLCISPVVLYEHAGKVVPATAQAADALVTDVFALLSPCRLPIATIGFDRNIDLIRVLADVHHDAGFMSTLAGQIDEMDLQYDLRAPGGGVRIPMSIAAGLIPDDMELKYFEPWYVKFVFTSRIEHRIAAQSRQHPEARPILSGQLSILLAELNELRRGVLKGIGDIDLLQICDIHRQYAQRPGYVLLGQTLDSTLAAVLRMRHCYVETTQLTGASMSATQTEAAVKSMLSNPFAEQEKRARRIASQADNFMREIHELCRSLNIGR